MSDFEVVDFSELPEKIDPDLADRVLVFDSDLTTSPYTAGRPVQTTLARILAKVGTVTYQGAWTAKSYGPGAVVTRLGSGYVTEEGVTSADVPGASAAWELLAGKGTDGTNGTNGTNGTDGTDGVDGEDGRTLLNGTTVPGSGIGAEGDFYLRTSTSVLYGPKVGSSWGSGVSLVGPTGATGANGSDGTGFNIRGTVANAAALPGGATDGDAYKTEDDDHLHVWDGAAWIDLGTIVGPAGADGAAGVDGDDGVNGVDGRTVLNGTTVPSNALGANGDFYLRTGSGIRDLYGPKTGGAWGTAVSLIGPAGAQGTQGLQGVAGSAGAQGPAGVAYLQHTGTAWPSASGVVTGTRVTWIQPTVSGTRPTIGSRPQAVNGDVLWVRQP